MFIGVLLVVPCKKGREDVIANSHVQLMIPYVTPDQMVVGYDGIERQRVICGNYVDYLVRLLILPLNNRKIVIRVSPDCKKDRRRLINEGRQTQVVVMVGPGLKSLSLYYTV